MDEPVKPGPNSGGQRRPARGKLWLFRWMAMLLPFLFLGLLELVLRIAGIGPDVRLVRPVKVTPTGMTHELNPMADFVYFGSANLQGPEWRQFQLPKPTGTYRIAFFGASTVIGFPYAPEVAFPRHLEVQLQQQNPDLRFEVLNLGITSINSFSVVDLLKQIVNCDVDLVIVHAGHNEFYGPGGPASSAGRFPTGLIPALYALKRTRLFQLGVMLNPFRHELDEHLLDKLPTSLEIRLNSPLVNLACDNYRQNLEEICRIAARHGVPVLLTTVASNLKDQAPMRSVWPENSTSEQHEQWDQRLRQAEARLMETSFEIALEQLEQLEQSLTGHARLTFRKAQSLEALGRQSDALAAYRQARDEDACRFRAPGLFRDIVVQVARTHPEVSFLDLEEEVATHSRSVAPGYDLFLEHVHYAFDGHVLLGRLLAEHIQTRILRKFWESDRALSGEELEQRLGLIPEDHLAAYSSALEVLQSGPLKAGLDARRHEDYLKQRLKEAYFSLDPGRRETFADIPVNVMVEDLIGALLYLHQIKGHVATAEKLERAARRRRPWTAP